jgi:hypothetical protein
VAWGLVGAVLEDMTDLPNPERWVLVVLAHHALPDSQLASPGMAALVHQSGLSRATVKRALRSLEGRRSLIKTTAMAAPGRVTVYGLLFDPVTSNGGHVGEPHSGTGVTQMNPVGPNGGHHDEPRWGGTTGVNSGATGVTHGEPDGGHPDDPPNRTDTSNSHPGARARWDEDDQDQPALTGRVLPPGTSLTQTDQRRADVIAAVQSAVKARTGKQLDDDEAETLAHSLLGSRSVRDPASYLGKVIRDEAKPGRLLPPRLSGTPQPQQWHARPRRPDQGDINERGGTLARQLLQARPGARTGPREDTHGRRPNEDHQAWALRQAAEARAARGEPPRTAGAAEDPLPDW